MPPRGGWGALFSVQVNPWEILPAVSVIDLPCDIGLIHAPHMWVFSSSGGLRAFRQCLGTPGFPQEWETGSNE